MDFDDGQRAYGKGTFAEGRGKIVLNKYVLIKKLYNLKGDSILKCDTLLIPRKVFYKKGDVLMIYKINPKTKERFKVAFLLSR